MIELSIKDLNNSSSTTSSIESLLEIYQTISIEFEVSKQYNFTQNQAENGKWKTKLNQVPIYKKNYDEYEKPISWCKKFDMSNWGIIFAYQANQLVGGAIIAWKTDGVNMLEGRDDLSVLWDIRINPEFRYKGIGRKLFIFVEDWSAKKGCKELKVETQNNNVNAILFYNKMGCEITEVNKNKYEGLPDEIQVILRKMINN